jgi:hypothetical protein
VGHQHARPQRRDLPRDLADDRVPHHETLRTDVNGSAFGHQHCTVRDACLGTDAHVTRDQGAARDLGARVDPRPHAVALQNHNIDLYHA